MKTRGFVICLLLVSVMLSACGPSKPAVDVAATQTAQAPIIKPTDTPVPTATPNALAGWNKFEGSGIEMWLPESFEGGNLENDLGVIVDKLKALGPEFESVAATIEANPAAFVLWAFDSELGSAGYLTNVNIIQEQVVSAVTLDMYLQALQQQLPSYLIISEQGKGQLDLYDSIRLVIDTEISGVKGKELMYIVKDSNTVYVITFATSLDEFEARLPAFEQAVQTFKTIE
jgi:hypothetical protein